MNEDLAFFSKLDYEVILKKNKNIYTLLIPELACYAEDESLDRAYEKLEAEKREYFQKMIENGYQQYIPRPKPSEKRVLNLSFLAPFFVKALAVVAVFALIFIVAFPQIQSASRKMTKKISATGEKLSRKMPERIRKNLSKWNQKFVNMPEEKKEARRLALRKTLAQVKPFVDEFKILFQDTVPAGSKDAEKPAPASGKP